METIDRTAAIRHREYGASRKQVTSKPLRHKTSVSVPWLAFEKRLAEAIGALEEDQYLVLSKKRGWGYVQFAAQGFYGIRAECVSNHYLDSAHALTKAQMDVLVALGWLAPTGTPEELRTNRRKGGSPNYYRDLEGPARVAKAARLAVRTLADVLDLPHPGYLMYKSFNKSGRSIVIPTLGLKREADAPAKTKPRAETVADIRALVVAALRQGSGDGDIKADADGDVALRFGNGIVFVRVLDDPACVRVYSPVLTDVTADDRLVGHLNALNAGVRHLRFFVLDGTIYAALELFLEPFVGEHVWSAYMQVGGFADEVGEDLRQESGGRRTFEDQNEAPAVQ